MVTSAERSDAYSSLGRIHTLLADGFGRMRRVTAWLISVLLVLNITVRSADPIKELFAASPWLHIYDDCECR
eukprot:COSAG06_NODE_5982_length_3170_cov_1755.745360_3_plen_72_part_00